MLLLNLNLPHLLLLFVLGILTTRQSEFFPLLLVSQFLLLLQSRLFSLQQGAVELDPLIPQLLLLLVFFFCLFSVLSPPSSSSSPVLLLRLCPDHAQTLGSAKDIPRIRIITNLSRLHSLCMGDETELQFWPPDGVTCIREAPLKFIPRLFGQCPNKGCMNFNSASPLVSNLASLALPYCLRLSS